MYDDSQLQVSSWEWALTALLPYVYAVSSSEVWMLVEALALWMGRSYIHPLRRTTLVLITTYVYVRTYT